MEILPAQEPKSESKIWADMIHSIDLVGDSESELKPSDLARALAPLEPADLKEYLDNEWLKAILSSSKS